MKIFITILLICLCLGITQPIFAQQGTIKIEDLLTNPGLTAEERNKLAKLVREKSGVSASIMNNLSDTTKWQEVGKAFSETIKDVCQTLNVEVNQFIKSDVGKLTAIIIVYKMVGKDVIRIGIILLFMFIVTFMIGISIYFIHGKKKWKVKKSDGSEEIIVKDRWISWSNDDIRTGSVIVHLVAWFVAICTATVQMIP